MMVDVVVVVVRMVVVVVMVDVADVAVGTDVVMVVNVIVIGLREKEGSGTFPLNSVSDGNMCPTENYLQQQRQQQFTSSFFETDHLWNCRCCCSCGCYCYGCFYESIINSLETLRMPFVKKH